MVPLRLASVALAATLGLVSGCMNLSSCSFLSRFRHNNNAPECCDVGDVCCDVGGVCCEGPILGDAGPSVVAPPPGAVVNPPLAPQNGVPPLTPAPPPRLVPQPQAPATPYTPQ